MISGEYEGGLEIFYEDQYMYMEKVKVTVDRIDNSYNLKVETTINLRLASLNLHILNFEQTSEDRVTVYVDLRKNEFYKTDEVGAYKNQIYLDISEDIISSQPKAEIRLCLSCLWQDNIKHVFIRVKK